MKAFEVLRQTTDQTSIDDLDRCGVPDEARHSFKLAMGHYILQGAHGLWYPEEEHVDGHAPERLSTVIGSQFYHLCGLYNGVKTGSPIEDRMAGALLWLDMDWACLPESDLLCGPAAHIEQFGPTDRLQYYITPQAKVGRYKADFMLWFSLGKFHGGLIVECDGHQFHEKNKEQAAKDKKRDRELLAAGYPVMRFTGSEIYQDVVGCVEQLRQPLGEILNRVSRDGGYFGNA